MTKPIALVKQTNPDEVVAYACGSCGTVVGTAKSHGSNAQGMAERCCAPPACQQCGAVHDRKHRLFCGPCEVAREAAREARRFAAAEHIPASDYDGPVYWDGTGNDGYSPSVADLLDWFADEETEPPAYVWACSVRHPSLDADDLLEHALDDHHEDCDLDAVDELRAFVARWNAQQTDETWDVDVTCAVLLTNEVES